MKFIVTGTSMVIEADSADDAIARAQESSGWHWEAEEHFAPDDALPIHYRDDERTLCDYGGTVPAEQGVCPRGCSGASEHYSNDGHRGCAEDARSRKPVVTFSPDSRAAYIVTDGCVGVVSIVMEGDVPAIYVEGELAGTLSLDDGKAYEPAPETDEHPHDYGYYEEN